MSVLAAFLRRQTLLVALCAGALHSFAYAPLAWRWLAPVTLALLFGLWTSVTPRRAAAIGFAFGAGLFLSGTYWIYHSVHTVAHAPAALALLLMLGLVVIMASYPALLGAAVTRFVAQPNSGWGSLAWPAGWVLLEWVRGWFLSGFPWLALGYATLDTPLAGWVPAVGVYGASLWVALLALALRQWFVVGNRTRLAMLVAAVVVVLAALGMSRLELTHPTGRFHSVALVQGAVAQDEKWEVAHRDHSFEVYRTLTEQSLGQDMVVWPESALPVLYHEAVPFLTPIYQAAQARHTDLLLGLVRYDSERAGYRNGLVALSDGETWYYKRRLVPFGEFFPVPEFVRGWMRGLDLFYVDFLPGDADQPALTAAGERIGATICYEDAYATEQRAVLKDATLLVNVSNDAWFGDSSAPHQHLEITRMRALEAGRWLMRATNTGITALIDPTGRVVARSPQFVPAVLKGTVEARTGLTPYARFGNGPVGAVCGVLLLLAWLGRRGGTRRSADHATRAATPG
jgi:apolipoprotein N-acyltransferase